MVMPSWAAIGLLMTIIFAVIGVFYRAGKLEGRFEAGLKRFDESVVKVDAFGKDLAGLMAHGHRIETVENTISAISNKATEILVKVEKQDTRLSNMEDKIRKISGQMPAVRVATPPRPGHYSNVHDEDEKKHKG